MNISLRCSLSYFRNLLCNTGNLNMNMILAYNIQHGTEKLMMHNSPEYLDT